MRKLVMLLALGTLILAGVSSSADEPNHMEFVRKMRDTNLADLALEYLDRLAASKDTPKDILAMIPLEKARVRMHMAAVEFNLDKRQKLYDQARKEFADFANAKKGDPLAAQAGFESARITALQGKSLITKALRLEEGPKQEAAKKALDKINQAAKELKAASEQLETLANGALPPDAKVATTQAADLAKLEMALNTLDKAATYEPLNEGLDKRGKEIQGAIADLKKLHAKDAKSPICWQAKAWAGKGFLELDTPSEAQKEFDAVIKADGAHTEVAKRLARYFMFENAAKREAAKVIPLGEEWLRLYSSYQRSPEGLRIRFTIGDLYLQQAQAIPKQENKLDPKAKDLYTKAQAIFTALSEVETDFNDQVQANLNAASIPLLSSTAAVAPDKITNFKELQQAFKALQFQLDNLPADKQKDRPRLLKQGVDILSRTGELAEAEKTLPPEADRAELRSGQAYLYLATDDPFKAAVLGEDTANRYTDKKAAPGGFFALQAYSQMIGKTIQNEPDSKSIDTDGDRSAKLLRHMEKVWPTDPITDAGRHVVGTMMLRRKKPKEAADFLSRVSSSYKPETALMDARWWWAVAARQMGSEKDITEADKQKYHDQALKALESMPEVSTNVPPDIAQMYVQAKLQYGQVLFESKKYDQMDALAQSLQVRLPKFKLDEGFKKDLASTIESLGYYAKFGRGMAELNAGKTAEAIKDTSPVIGKVREQINKIEAVEAEARKKYDALEEKKKTKDLSKEESAESENLKDQLDRMSQNLGRDNELLRGLLMVSLRACVLDGNMALATSRLEDLQKSAAKSSVGPAVYVDLVKQLHRHIKELEGDPKKVTELKKNIDSFTEFLKKVAEKPLTPEIIFFLANSYSSIGNHGEAGLVLAKVPDPGQPKDPKNPTQEEQRKMNLFRAAKMMALKELRLGKKYPEAEKTLLAIKNTKWGEKSLQVDEESAYLFQDQAKWGAAAVAWKNMMAKLSGDRATFMQPRIQEQYYDCYFNYVFCSYQYGVTNTDAKKKQDNITAAANAIVKLEETKPDRGGEAVQKKYEELLKKEPVLKSEYDRLKKAAAAAATAPAPGK